MLMHSVKPTIAQRALMADRHTWNVYSSDRNIHFTEGCTQLVKQDPLFHATVSFQPVAALHRKRCAFSNGTEDLWIQSVGDSWPIYVQSMIAV